MKAPLYGAVERDEPEHGSSTNPGTIFLSNESSPGHVLTWPLGLRFCAGIGLAVFIVTNLAGNTFFDRAEDNISFNVEAQQNTGVKYSRHQHTSNISNSGCSMTLDISNNYTHLQGKSGLQYPWLYEAGRELVEPYRQTTLSILSNDFESCAKIKEFEFVIEGEGFPTYNTTTSNSFVKYMFDAPNRRYNLSVSGRSHRGIEEVQISVEVICKYVRRELRTLTAIDRKKFFETARLLWVTSKHYGKVHYGDNFKPIRHFIEEHTQLAGTMECDHMHDGLGFMTNHLGLSAEFELALQSVDPVVSLPYWDYTIEAQWAIDNHDSNFSWITQAEIFDPDWFGRSSKSQRIVTEGRWAYTNVEVANNKTVVYNGYGLIRAPWNANGSPYVSRSTNEMCGRAPMAWVTCTSHYNLLTHYNSWYSFAWQLPYIPHGPVHAFIGGSFGCSDVFDWAETEVGLSSELSFDLRTQMYSFLKNLYRGSDNLVDSQYTTNGSLISCPTYCGSDVDQMSCACTCTQNKTDPDWYFGYSEYICEISPAFCTDLSRDQQSLVVEKMCEAGWALTGDSLEAGSPADISFWPMHPTIERLWQYKKLGASGGFINEDWISHCETSECPSLWKNCSGHGVNDVLKWKNLFDNDDYFYTNMDLYTLADPHNRDGLPYIFDNFKWDHCTDYDFTSLLTTTSQDDDASSTTTTTTTDMDPAP